MTDAARVESTLPGRPGAAVEALRASLDRLARLLRERALFESAALLLPILLVGATQARGPWLWLAAATYLGASAWVVARAPTRSAGGVANGRWEAARVLLGVAIVATGQLLSERTGLLSSVYLPVIALSAFGGRRLPLLAVGAAVLAQLGVESFVRGDVVDAASRSLGFTATALLVAVGTRREVDRMRRARDRLRHAVSSDRRRARQIAGVESIGRILAGGGPTPEVLEEVVDRIATQFGFPYVSLYLGTPERVTLGAQRGYTELIEGFDGSRGIVGRVMRSGRPAFVPDVGADPDYWGLNPGVRSEICVPLLADAEFLGFLNVESTERPLDATDLRIMTSIADRVAAALIIGRDRQRLAERAELFRHLHDFGEAVSGTLEPDELYEAIVRAVPSVVPADVVMLHVLDADSGRWLLRAVHGADAAAVGIETLPGRGMAGRAIRERTMIVDTEALGRGGLRTVAAGFLSEASTGAMAGAAFPLIRDGAVIGALTVMRARREAPFSALERDALDMVADQAVLGVTNAMLHAEVATLALRDPLTGLFNRRYLDPAVEQLFARRARAPVEERGALAAIMFDLDRFSELNNRHGHQVGDEVLRTFGGILRGRLRATDLVARFGGEEFAVILYRATLDDAVRVADEIRQALAATTISGSSGEPLTATVSAGCAAIGPDHDSPEELLRAADVALYMAKRAGRDRVCAA